MSSIASSADWTYCREVLPRVSRTFAINIRLLRGPMRDAVEIAYLLCRIGDALEDSWPGTSSEIRSRFERLREAIAGSEAAAAQLAREVVTIAAGRDDLALVAGSETVLRCFRSLDQRDRAAIEDCLSAMTLGMCRYASRAAGAPPGSPYLESEDELRDYCWVVAGCVGVMLTRLFDLHHGDPQPERSATRLLHAAQLGEALQLTNIILDWPADVRRGRCFVPRQWLDELHLTPADLVGGPRPGQQAVLDRLEALARRAFADAPAYLEAVPLSAVRYRLFCLWPLLWAAASLRVARRDAQFPWGASRPRLPKSRLWSLALGSLLAVHHPSTLRRSLRSAGALARAGS